MLRTRVIPCLLLQHQGLVKTLKFRNPKYIGDPINTIKIFNDKEVDELIILDIAASREKTGPNYSVIETIATECFMPVCYGGGITNYEQVEALVKLGIEKVTLNTAAFTTPGLITKLAEAFGSQAIVVAVDVKKNLFGKYEVVIEDGTQTTKKDPVTYAKEVARLGAGELFVNSIDRDGTMQGYDTSLIAKVAAAVTVPVIASGGAGTLQDFTEAVNAGASAVAAGSMFVFHGPHRAVLINYPGQDELRQVLPE